VKNYQHRTASNALWGFAKKIKGREGVFIEGVACQNGLGFRSGFEIDGQGLRRDRAGLLRGEEED
jgi:hypothetical protein